MTTKQELLRQIEALYECWARDGLNSESTARTLNGLFELAKDGNAKAMQAAWKRGVQAEAERINHHFHVR